MPYGVAVQNYWRIRIAMHMAEFNILNTSQSVIQGIQGMGCPFMKQRSQATGSVDVCACSARAHLLQHMHAQLCNRQDIGMW
jgi:hypothetical protein